MRILITNDDGIHAPGLAVLETLAQEIVGTEGEVWTVAPLTEKSGVGHCISYTSPIRYQREQGDRRFAVDGTPADCVLAGLHHFVQDPVDLVLSGINSGNNSAENTVYSGTIGAAMEAALAGIPAIALSQFYGPQNKDLEDRFEAARYHGLQAILACLQAGFVRTKEYSLFYNVNFPPVAAQNVQGLRAVAQGYRGDGAFSATPTEAPNGRQFLFIHGQDQQRSTAPGTDVAANLEGYVSITPMRADLTAHDHLDAVAQALLQV